MHHLQFEYNHLFIYFSPHILLFRLNCEIFFFHYEEKRRKNEHRWASRVEKLFRGKMKMKIKNKQNIDAALKMHFQFKWKIFYKYYIERTSLRISSPSIPFHSIWWRTMELYIVHNASFQWHSRFSFPSDWVKITK